MNQNRKVIQSAVMAGALAIMTSVTGANAATVPAEAAEAQAETVAVVENESNTAGVVKYLGEAASGSLQQVSLDVLQNDVLLVAEGEDADEDGAPTAGVIADILSEEMIPVAIDGAVADTIDTGLVSEPAAAEPAAEETVEAAADPVANEADAEAVAEAETAEEIAPGWDVKLMATVEDSLNVRAAASEDAEVIGKLYAGSVADVVESADGWAHIVSGSVDGYVSEDYCVTAADAYSYALEVCSSKAVTTTGGLRLRAEAAEDAGIISTLEEGSTLTVRKDAEAPEGWVAVSYNGSDGFVSADYVEVSLNTSTALTIEEEQAKLAAEQKEKAKSEQVQATGNATQSGSTAASYDDVTLLAALIQTEAGGQPYEGQVAVGDVVVNRLRSGAYGGSISSVIYAPGQFGPAASGAVARVAAAGPSATAIAAAQAALNGENYIGACTQFRNVACGHPGTVIGSHVFW